MKLKKMLCAALSGILLLSGCASKTSGAGSDDSGPAEIEAGSQLTQIDMTKWQYQEDTDVYWQVGIPYCETPADRKSVV